MVAAFMELSSLLYIIIVILQGGTTNTDFKGFMIQGRVCGRSDYSPVGKFIAGYDYRPTCYNNVSRILTT